VWLLADHRTEVTEGLVPLFLVDVDLPPCDVSLDIAGVAHQSLRKGAQGTDVVVDAAVSDRKHDIDGLTVVRTNFNQLIQVKDRLLGLT
jgi:hypothetical protein